MSIFRITLAQLNPTIGDFAGNIALMRKAAAIAQADNANMVVFPELSLTAYSPGDLLDEPDFVNQTEAGIAELVPDRKLPAPLNGRGLRRFFLCEEWTGSAASCGESDEIGALEHKVGGIFGQEMVLDRALNYSSL